MAANFEDPNQHSVASLNEDEDAALREAMGFSSFGAAKKPLRQPRGPADHRGFGTGANSQPVHQRKSSAGTPSRVRSASRSSFHAQPFVPASLPPIPFPAPGSEGLLWNNPQDATPFPAPIQSIQQTFWNPSPEYLDDYPVDSGFPYQHSALQPLPPMDRRDEITYTNPQTGISFTRAELSNLEKGVTKMVPDNTGEMCPVKVYFKPSFVEDDPWKGLTAQLAEVEGEGVEGGESKEIEAGDADEPGRAVE